MALPGFLANRLSIPLIAAPMTGVSSLELVLECCRNGVIGAFPTNVVSSVNELDRWLADIQELTSGRRNAPAAPNLVVHRTNTRLKQDLDCLIRRGAELVITSVGSPRPVLDPLHEAGCTVFADVATLHHVERAVESGVDGLVLLTAGAGGQTGWINPLSFVRAVRERFDGPIVLAGGVGDGTAVLCSLILGADLAYMGTRFIATEESAASAAYKTAIVQASIDDVEMTLAKTGLPANFLRSWIESAGLNGSEAPSKGFDYADLLSSKDGWGAGHSVHGVTGVLSVRALIAKTREEYAHACEALRVLAESTSDASRHDRPNPIV